MAPEYAMRGHLTEKADVYSFGIVALEIVSGRSNVTKEDMFYLLDWVILGSYSLLICIFDLEFISEQIYVFSTSFQSGACIKRARKINGAS